MKTYKTIECNLNLQKLIEMINEEAKSGWELFNYSCEYMNYMAVLVKEKGKTK